MQPSRFFLKDTIPANLIKNLAQYMFGILAFYLTFGHIDIFKAVVGGLAFLFCYSAVYPFNDLMDLKEDRKKSTKESKALVRGAISKKDSISLLFLLLAVGIFFLMFLEEHFIFIIALVLLLNFFHSSNLIRAKKNFYTVSFNMFFMQFLKYLSGWFALTNDLHSAPILLAIAFSTAYMGSYLYYNKSKIHKGISLRKKLIIGLFTTLGFGSYLISFFVSRFKVPILTLTGISITYMLFLRREQEGTNQPHWANIQLKSLSCISIIFIFCFASLLIPQVAKANRLLDEEIKEYRRNFSDQLPDSLTMKIEQWENETEFLLEPKGLQEKIELWKVKLNNETKN